MVLSKPVAIKVTRSHRFSAWRGRQNWSKNRTSNLVNCVNSSTSPPPPGVRTDYPAGPSVLPLPPHHGAPPQNEFQAWHATPYLQQPPSPPQNPYGYLDMGYPRYSHAPLPPPTVDYQNGESNCQPYYSSSSPLEYFTPPGSIPQDLSYSPPPGFAHQSFATNSIMNYEAIEASSFPAPPPANYYWGVDQSMMTIYSPPQLSPPLSSAPIENYWQQQQPTASTVIPMMNPAPYDFNGIDQGPIYWVGWPNPGPYQAPFQLMDMNHQVWIPEPSPSQIDPVVAEPKIDEAISSKVLDTDSITKNESKKQVREKAKGSSSRKAQDKEPDKSRSSSSESDIHCRFCKSNRETREFYESHSLKAGDGKTTNCPILRKYICPLCSATGDDAHTLGYCPKNLDNHLKGRRRSKSLSLMRNSVGRIGAYRFG